jgi:hypothetical protein
LGKAFDALGAGGKRKQQKKSRQIQRKCNLGRAPMDFHRSLLYVEGWGKVPKGSESAVLATFRSNRSNDPVDFS